MLHSSCNTAFTYIVRWLPYGRWPCFSLHTNAWTTHVCNVESWPIGPLKWTADNWRFASDSTSGDPGWEEMWINAQMQDTSNMHNIRCNNFHPVLPQGSDITAFTKIVCRLLCSCWPCFLFSCHCTNDTRLYRRILTKWMRHWSETWTRAIEWTPYIRRFAFDSTGSDPGWQKMIIRSSATGRRRRVLIVFPTKDSIADLLPRCLKVTPNQRRTILTFFTHCSRQYGEAIPLTHAKNDCVPYILATHKPVRLSVDYWSLSACGYLNAMHCGIRINWYLFIRTNHTYASASLLTYIVRWLLCVAGWVSPIIFPFSHHENARTTHACNAELTKGTRNSTRHEKCRWTSDGRNDNLG